MRVMADQERCVGSGMCVRVVSDVFDQREEDGTVRLLQDDVPAEIEDRVRLAARVCPSQAITLLGDLGT